MEDCRQSGYDTCPSPHSHDEGTHAHSPTHAGHSTPVILRTVSTERGAKTGLPQSRTRHMRLVAWRAIEGPRTPHNSPREASSSLALPRAPSPHPHHPRVSTARTTGLRCESHGVRARALSPDPLPISPLHPSALPPGPSSSAPMPARSRHSAISHDV